VTDDQQQRIAAAWTEAVDQHVASLSEADFAAMISRTRSQSMAAKADQLWGLTQQCSDGQGYTAGIADAAAARGPAWQPPPEFSQQPRSPGFAPNRAQSASRGDAPSSPTPPPAPRRIR
jgi:hypothetical protein